jgi:uncharacterized protein (UPF0548 family)
MFLRHRPSAREIDAFLAQARQLPLSYARVGLASQSPPGYSVDEASVVLGAGHAVFERSWDALRAWRQFDLGWVELLPHAAPVEPGTVVAVVVRHVGFWSMNGCRLVYTLGDRVDERGFAYGTLTNHAESGEEIFKVSMDASTGAVSYSIRAVARPRALLARCGYPITRYLQARFRADSLRAMQRATAGVAGREKARDV